MKQSEERINRPVTVNLTQQEYAFVKKALPDASLSRLLRRLLLEQVHYPMPQPQN